MININIEYMAKTKIYDESSGTQEKVSSLHVKICLYIITCNMKNGGALSTEETGTETTLKKHIKLI